MKTRKSAARFCIALAAAPICLIGGCQRSPNTYTKDTETTASSRDGGEVSGDSGVEDSDNRDTEDAGDCGISTLRMEATTQDEPLPTDRSCPVPTAPVLTVIDAEEILRFSTNVLFNGEIETGISLNPDADAPDAWTSSSEVEFSDAAASYTVRVFARAVADDCRTDRLFSHIYNVRCAYPGPVHALDTTAIPMDSATLVAWATQVVSVVYGNEVDEKWRVSSAGLGPAEGNSFDVVSLGDGGEITVGFDVSIVDDVGFDFAVFENSVSDGFLDLAFVEVSTDGTIFARFDTASRTEAPVGPFETLDTAGIEGLAGKYPQGFGQPFDLHALSFADEVLRGAVDLRDIRYIRIVDAVGDAAATDSFGRPIYDPYPCTGSAGFDLDAIGVINAAL